MGDVRVAGWADRWINTRMDKRWVGWQINGQMDRQGGQEDAWEGSADLNLETRQTQPSPLPQKAQHRGHGLSCLMSQLAIW